MWDDYAVPGGAVRENLYGLPGQTFLPDCPPLWKFKLNALEHTANGEVMRQTVI
jgi:hypothetical protein